MEFNDFPKTKNVFVNIFYRFLLLLHDWSSSPLLCFVSGVYDGSAGAFVGALVDVVSSVVGGKACVTCSVVVVVVVVDVVVLIVGALVG